MFHFSGLDDPRRVMWSEICSAPIVYHQCYSFLPIIIKHQAWNLISTFFKFWALCGASQATRSDNEYYLSK